MILDLLPAMFRRARARRLAKSAVARRIRVHSVSPQPPDAARPDFLRIAFDFVDPPGPWSIQFYEAETPSPEVSVKLTPGLMAKFYESEDGARTRVFSLEDGTLVLPR